MWQGVRVPIDLFKIKPTAIKPTIPKDVPMKFFGPDVLKRRVLYPTQKFPKQIIPFKNGESYTCYYS